MSKLFGLVFILLLMVSIYLLVSFDMNSSTKKSLESSPGQSVKIVMLGDSITFRTNWRILLNRNDVLNRGINGNTTGDMLKRLDAIIDMKPEYCFIMGGINDISHGFAVEKIYENYTILIQKLIRNRIRSVVQSTLFVSSVIFKSGEINRQVEELNSRLKEFTENNQIYFIDLNATLCPGNGLSSEYTVDGIHLSLQGYRAWKEVLIPYLNKLNLK